MNFKQAVGAFIALTAMFGTVNSSARADELGYYATLTATSDYIFRGISYYDQDIAPQVDFGLTYGNFYGGAWGSLNEFADIYGPWELDYYFGYSTETGPVTWDFTAWYNTYGVADPSVGSGDLNYFEMSAKASINPTDKLTLSLLGDFTPAQKIAITNTQTVEAAAAYTLNDIGKFTPTASGLIGFTNTDVPGYWLGKEDYTYWNAGMDFAINSFDFDFRYWDTDIDNDLADARFVFTASVSLP